IEDRRAPQESLAIPPAVKRPAQFARYQKLIKVRAVFIGLSWIVILFPLCMGIVSAIKAAPTWYQHPLAWASLPFALYKDYYWLILFILAVVSAVGAIVTRKRAVRVLLLRPFRMVEMTAPLKRVVVKHLAPEAHTYTLSDRNYKPSIVLKVIEGFGELLKHMVVLVIRPSFRVGVVKNELTFFEMAKRLSGSVRPASYRIYGGGQAFNIKSTEPWWKTCIDLLMPSCDIIVTDVSRVGEGSAWEIPQLGARNLLKKCIFIVEESFAKD